MAKNRKSVSTTDNSDAMGPKQVALTKGALKQNSAKPAQVKPAQVKKTPAKPTPAKQTQAKPAKVKPIPAKPAQPKPAQPKPAQPKPAQVTKTPAKQTPAKQTPAKQTPAKQTPAKQTPAKQTQAKPTKVKQTPSKQNQTKETPAKQSQVIQSTEESVTDITHSILVQPFDPLSYLTPSELEAIDNQFASTLAAEDAVLFWTGVSEEHVLKWAAIWGLKTLRLAMGPLMDKNSPRFVAREQSMYKRYVKGASARFAQYACKHCRVIVLTSPPPDIYSNRNDNTYQTLEEPILQGVAGNRPVRRIDYLHPQVDGAAHVTYQVWPKDKSKDWTASFGRQPVTKWSKLEWCYKNLVTTSHMNLPENSRLLSHATALLADPRAAYQTQRERAYSDHPSSSPIGIIPEKSSVVRECADLAECVLRSSQTVLNVNDAVVAFGSDVDDHELGDMGPGPMRQPSVNRDGGCTEIQGLIQTKQEIESHESGFFEDSGHLSPTSYVIETCTPPFSLTAIPVINIEDMPVGVDVNFALNAHGPAGDFLYLTMKDGARLQWWRLRWTSTETLSTGHPMGQR